MTAGRGIVHSERTSPEQRAAGARIHGIQSWVALPDEHEETAPSFSHHEADELPRQSLNGSDLVLIAGSAFDMESPVETFSEIFYVDAQMPAGSVLPLPLEQEQRAAYVVQGNVAVGDARYHSGRMIILMPGEDTAVEAIKDSRVMLLGGAPLGERFIWWNFVASSEARIEQAKSDWAQGRFPQVPGETESIPLPQ